MNSNIAPLARREEIVVQNADGEVLIYDLRKNKAFCLNQTSAIVWESCDGTRDIDAIAAEAGKKAKQNITSDLVMLALADLKKEGLVSYAEPAGFNRREAIRRIGTATMLALPIVTSLAAPSAASAQSNVAACLNCTVGIGVGAVYTCPGNCAGLTCTCYGNNSCMGIGQAIGTTTCTACESVNDGMGAISTANNSFRCV